MWNFKYVHIKNKIYIKVTLKFHIYFIIIYDYNIFVHILIFKKSNLNIFKIDFVNYKYSIFINIWLFIINHDYY